MTATELKESARADEKRRLFVQHHHEELRRARGLVTQRAVAQVAHVHQPYICRVEAGSTEGIGEESLRRIIATYEELADVPFGSFLLREKDRLQHVEGPRS